MTVSVTLSELKTVLHKTGSEIGSVSVTREGPRATRKFSKADKPAR